MLDLLVIALLQSVAGEPNVAGPAAPAPQEQAVGSGSEALPGETPAAETPLQEATGNEPLTEASAPTSTAETSEPGPTPRTEQRRVCQQVVMTGRRHPQRVCRTVAVERPEDDAAGGS